MSCLDISRSLAIFLDVPEVTKIRLVNLLMRKLEVDSIKVADHAHTTFPHDMHTNKLPMHASICMMFCNQVKLHRHFLESPHVKLLLSGGRAAARAACNSASAGIYVRALACRHTNMLIGH